MPTETEQLPLLDQLRAQRKELSEDLVKFLDARNVERETYEKRVQDGKETAKALASDDERSAHRKRTDEERAAFDAAEDQFEADFDAREKQIKRVEQRIREEKRREKAEAAAAKASRQSPSMSVTKEPLTYREDNAREISYFGDIVRISPQLAGYLGEVDDGTNSSSSALDRLQRHAKETESWLPKRAAERERRAEAQIEAAERSFTGSFVPGLVQRRGLDASPFERRVNPNRTDGQGGYFVPPLWLIDQYIPGLRAGRVAAGLCRQMPLPPGTDSVNIPKLSTLTLTAPQNSDNAPVASQDYTDTVVTANVKTLAGQEDVAIQLLDQAPGRILDQVIMQDLLADYNRLVDRQLLYSPGTNNTSLNAGQIQGIYPSSNWSGTNTVTWTSNPTLGGAFHNVLNANTSRIAYNRFDLSNVHHLVHPRRWFWYAGAVDGASGTSGRPLVESSSFGPFNVAALEQASVPMEGLAGRLAAGQNVYIDGNVPTTDNGSGVLTGSYDLAITAKWDDLWLFEGDLRTRVLPEILSGTLQVRFQVYNYVAFLARYGQSIALAQGAGFAAPASAFGSEVTF